MYHIQRSINHHLQYAICVCSLVFFCLHAHLMFSFVHTISMEFQYSLNVNFANFTFIVATNMKMRDASQCLWQFWMQRVFYWKPACWITHWALEALEDVYRNFICRSKKIRVSAVWRSSPFRSWENNAPNDCNRLQHSWFGGISYLYHSNERNVSFSFLWRGVKLK